MQTEKLWDIHQLVKNYPCFTHWGVRYLLRERRIPFVRIGSRLYFDPVDIADWIKEKKVKEHDYREKI